MAGKTILVAEDEAVVGLGVTSFLERSGYTVPSLVSNADELIPRVMKDNPDLLLCDVRLGSYLDGIEAVKRLKLVKSSLPVVFMTGYDDSHIRQRAESASPHPILIKPFEEHALLDSIQKALDD